MKLLLRSKLLLTFHSLSRTIVSTTSPHSKKIALKLDTEEIIDDPSLKNKVSTLYVPGRSGGNVYQFVKPLIDVKFIEENRRAIEDSCKVRGIDLDCNHLLDTLKEWYFKKNEHEKLCDQYNEYKDEVNRLKALNLLKESEELNKKSNECIDLIKIAKGNVNDIEDVLMPLLQRVPNILDSSTPINNDIISIHREPQVITKEVLPHVEIGKCLSLIEFTNVSPTAYYLKGPLAELEIALQVYFSEKLQNVHFAPMSCVDFAKSFIVEATGLDPHSCDDCIPLKRNTAEKSTQCLNLVGGASFQSFCAYLVNMNASLETLPARYYSLGRHYDAYNRHSSIPSLFTVVQSSAIHSTILCDLSNEATEFNALFEILLASYAPLEIPFRTVNLAAARLNHAESRKTQLELWSSSLKKYVPVAYVSQRNDFVSKRLHITYGKEYTINGYCSIVEGMVVNLPVIIGCMLEHFAKYDEVDFDKINNLIKTS